jgi:hypothetical protein
LRIAAETQRVWQISIGVLSATLPGFLHEKTKFSSSGQLGPLPENTRLQTPHWICG